MMAKRPARKGRFVKCVLFLMASLIAAWLGGFAWFVKSLDLEAMPDDLVTDGIVVLTGGPSRIKAAVELLEQGLGARLLISGVNQTVSPEELRRALNISPEIFSCCIDLGRTALNTRDNAIEAADWARARHYKSIRVVTAIDHMPRSLVEFRRVMPSFEIVPHPIAAGAFPLSGENGSWVKLSLEYSKYLISLARARFLSPPSISAPVKAI